MRPPQLSGMVDTRDQQIADLTERLRVVSNENESLKAQIRSQQIGVAALKKFLEPFYVSLQAIWGEIVILSSSETDPDRRPPSNEPVAQVWNAWKTRLGPSTAKVIDALFVHRRMTKNQLKVATGLTGATTIRDIISKMKALGLISQDGEFYSLKELS